MDLRPHISIERLSHAYVVEGDHGEMLPAVRSLIAHFGITQEGNPDYHEQDHDVFTVDDARELRRVQGLHSLEGGKKIFVVSIRTISHESQNALLKTIEEPTEHTHFFFLVRNSAMFLPTVRSRVQVISPKTEVTSRESGGENSDAHAFFRSSIPERFKIIARMTKAKADDKSEAKEEARDFLTALERTLAKKLNDEDYRFARSLEDVLYAERELSGRSPSLKLLLEHLALTIPLDKG